MPDLFGNDDRLETHPTIGDEVGLFDAKAEAIAYANGRNVAQVKNELVHGVKVGSTTWGHDANGAWTCDTQFAPKRHV